MSGNRGSGFDTRFSFFFNLVEKNSFTVKKISKCRENGIDRLRNGNLPRRDCQLYLSTLASWIKKRLRSPSD